MAVDRNNDVMDGLITNSFEFLQEALNPALLKERPARAIVSFVIGVELILKAKLVSEHWSLILKIPGDISFDSFHKGNFSNSVGIAEAIERIDKVCNEKIKKELHDSLKIILHTRNKIVHFYHNPVHKEDIQEKVFTWESLIPQMLIVWLRLKKYMEGPWSEIFHKYSSSIVDIDKSLNTLKEYLGAKYNESQSEIIKLKETCYIETCESCSYDAFVIEREDINRPIYTDGRCLVCGYIERVFCIKCPDPKCEQDIYYVMVDACHDVVCNSCDNNLHIEFEAELDNESICCFHCENTISKMNEEYVCFGCDIIFDDDCIIVCDFCNQVYASEDRHALEYSSHYGCPLCEETAKWHNDD